MKDSSLEHEGLGAPTERRVRDRRKDSFFHEFRGTGVPQILLGIGELLIPVVVLLKFDEVARDLGVGLLGSLGLILFFAAASYRRVFRRGEVRRALERGHDDPIDLVEEVEDHWTDFFRGAALLLVLWAMMPTTKYVLEIHDALNAAVFVLSDVVVGGAAAVSLFEGWRRRALHLAIESGSYRFLPPGERDDSARTESLDPADV